jgi:AcrR family transcriptional regulator
MTTRTGHRPSQRDDALVAALDLLRDGGSLSLESAARAAGLSKPGLMYHFPTKESLLLGLVDHVIDAWERDLVAARGADDGPSARMAAYLRCCLGRRHDTADLVMLSDPRLRDRATSRWADRLGSWVEVPADLPEDVRTRLHLVRMVADGCWFGDAAGYHPLADADREAVLAAGLRLLRGEEP